MEQLRLVEVEDQGPGETRKQCRDCGRWKEVGIGFGAILHQKSGAITWRQSCKDCTSKNLRVTQEFRASGAFAAMMARQRGKCAACASPLSSNPKEVHVDHCHQTDEVCGILCRGCNVGAGHLDDDPERAALLAAYLVRTRRVTK